MVLRVHLFGHITAKVFCNGLFTTRMSQCVKILSNGINTISVYYISGILEQMFFQDIVLCLVNFESL